jgi:hypothetical protein
VSKLHRVLALSIGLSSPSLAQQDTARITVVPEQGAAFAMSRAELAALPQLEVLADSGRTRYRGPALRAILTRAGAPAGHLRGKNLTLAVLVECADGYRVVYSLAELEEQGARATILALTRNDQALPEKDGPFRVAMPGELHHSRWARQVVRMRLLQVNPP